jgi:hypothetical protein
MEVPFPTVFLKRGLLLKYNTIPIRSLMYIRVDLISYVTVPGQCRNATRIQCLSTTNVARGYDGSGDTLRGGIPLCADHI